MLRLPCYAWIAQLVEHTHGKGEVTGSIPVSGSDIVSKKCLHVVENNIRIRKLCHIGLVTVSGRIKSEHKKFH
jgi:hypothetical protein